MNILMREDFRDRLLVHRDLGDENQCRIRAQHLIEHAEPQLQLILTTFILEEGIDDAAHDQLDHG